MMPDTEHDTIAVTLQLAPEVHESFAKKARKAGMGLETYLSNALVAMLDGKTGDKILEYSPHKSGRSGG